MGAKQNSEQIKATHATADDKRFMQAHSDELSQSTLRAHWVHAPDDREDRPGETLATRSHDVIRHWAEERGGKPSTVAGTEHDDHVGVLRFNFPDYGGHDLQQISWDEWFKPFDQRQLVFLFQQHTSDGRQSNFFRLDNPGREDA